MAEYEISGEVTDLSELAASKVNEKLSPLVGKTGEVFCLCQHTRPPMHVSRRGGNYFPVKEKETGELHYKLCRHHSLTAPEAAAMSYTLEALSSSVDEELVVTLAKPLKKGTKSVAATLGQYAFKQGPARQVTNRMTELGLLHLLWERARLHEYRPSAIVTSLWPKIRRAAYGIRPAGLRGLEFGLADLLLLPLHAENPEQKTWNFAKFKDAQKKNRFLLFSARLAQAEIGALLAAEVADFSLKTHFGFNISLYKDGAKPVLDALKDSFSDELNYSQGNGDDLIVLGIAQPNATKNYATISSLVVMPVVKGHLPYDSKYEKDFALELIHRARWFKKPLRYEAARDMHVHPDFVLLDTPTPVVVEVYGMATPDYLERKAEKRLIYSSEDYPFDCWEWDAAACKDLAKWLPSHPLPSN